MISSVDVLVSFLSIIDNNLICCVLVCLIYLVKCLATIVVLPVPVQDWIIAVLLFLKSSC
jgi:hypothetical protein